MKDGDDLQITFNFVARIESLLLRPIPKAELLPCPTKIKVSFRFKHGSSTPFVTIRLGTAKLLKLGSARLLSTAAPCRAARQERDLVSYGVLVSC